MCFYTRQMYHCRCPIAPAQLIAFCEKYRNGVSCCPNVTYQYTRQYCDAHQWLDMFKDTGYEQVGSNGAVSKG